MKEDDSIRIIGVLSLIYLSAVETASLFLTQSTHGLEVAGVAFGGLILIAAIIYYSL